MENQAIINYIAGQNVYTTEEVGRYNKGFKLRLQDLPTLFSGENVIAEFETIENSNGAFSSPCTNLFNNTFECVVPDIVMESAFPVYAYIVYENVQKNTKKTVFTVVINIFDRVKALNWQEQIPDASQLFSTMLAHFDDMKAIYSDNSVQVRKMNEEIRKLVPEQIENAKLQLTAQNNQERSEMTQYFEDIKKQLAEDPNNFVQQMNDLKASVQADRETITTSVAKVDNMEAGLHESTNEHFTGKYYYDGRKIYERTIILTGGFAADTWVWSDVLDSSIDDSTVRFLGESTYRISSLVWPLPNYESDVAYVRLHLNRSSKQIGVRAGKNVTGGTAVVIYQYCKKA